MKQNCLAYRCLGAGPAVVLLHGLLGMSDNLLSLAKKIAQTHQVILPDAINHGQSPHADIMDYATMAEHVVDLLDELALEKAGILGHSMGGKTAMQLASDYAERVQCLIVADIAPVAYPARYHLALFAAMQAVQSTTIHNRHDADAILIAQGVDELPLRQFLLKNLKKDQQNNWSWQCGLNEIIANYSRICDAPILREGMTVPSLFIKGGASEYVLPAHIAVIQQYFSAAQIDTIEHASHWLHAEYPDIFAHKVLTFLAENGEY